VDLVTQRHADQRRHRADRQHTQVGAFTVTEAATVTIASLTIAGNTRPTSTHRHAVVRANDRSLQ